MFRNLVPFFMGEKYFQGSGQKYNDFLKTKKMRNVRTINLAVVSRRDLYYVSENKRFCFGHFLWVKNIFRNLVPVFFDILIFGVGVGWPSPEIEKYIPRNYIWRIVFSYVLAKSRMPNITNPL